MGIRRPPFSLRLSFEQRARLEQEAGDMSLGGYIHSRLFDSGNPPVRRRSKNPVKVHKVLAQALGLLGQSRISSNLGDFRGQGFPGAVSVFLLRLSRVSARHSIDGRQRRGGAR